MSKKKIQKNDGAMSFVLQSFVIHIICPTSHLSYMAGKTSFVLRIICPTPHLSYTSFVLHLIYPTHHLSYISFVLHIICPTHHLSYTSFVLHLICPTLHLSYRERETLFVLHFICQTLQRCTRCKIWTNMSNIIMTIIFVKLHTVEKLASPFLPMNFGISLIMSLKVFQQPTIR